MYNIAIFSLSKIFLIYFSCSKVIFKELSNVVLNSIFRFSKGIHDFIIAKIEILRAKGKV